MPKLWVQIDGGTRLAQYNASNATAKGAKTNRQKAFCAPLCNKHLSPQIALKAAKAQLDQPKISIIGAANEAPVTPNMFCIGESVAESQLGSSGE